MRVMVESKDLFLTTLAKGSRAVQSQNALGCPLYLSNALTADALFGF